MTQQWAGTSAMWFFAIMIVQIKENAEVMASVNAMWAIRDRIAVF